MEKVKYQIFISSTYSDLKDEREQVIKACLEMGHIPVGMEMFSAADEEQWKIITRQIDESDYYVLIIANRYGSTVEGISYTEKEYDYAIEKGVPVLGFMLDPLAAWPSDRFETGDYIRKKLDVFRQKVKRKPVNFWTSKEDLHGKCAVALMKTFNTQPRSGWVRTPETVGQEVVAELSRLSSENAALREEIEELRKSSDLSNLSQEEDTITIHFVLESIGNKLINIITSWNELFMVVATAIIEKPLESEARSAINQFYYQQVKELYLAESTDDEPININHIRWLAVKIIPPDFSRIRIQLMALKLLDVEYISTDMTISNQWMLTEFGKNQYASQFAHRRS